MNHNKFDITKEFKKYIVQKSTETMEDFCLPKKFKFQPQQIFLRDFLSSKFSPWLLYNNDIRGTLLYHQIGAGKTCTAICIAEQFKKKLKIISTTIEIPKFNERFNKSYEKKEIEIYTNCNWADYLFESNLFGSTLFFRCFGGCSCWKSCCISFVSSRI